MFPVEPEHEGRSKGGKSLEKAGWIEIKTFP